ncbi:MAG: FKBP-type peptidyl-prolyl cis-trans isomerase [Deltaproteobacteria bacterium]|nr:FKBP-type peptidyl-prolyl cis-trans isomerase [Deltaproteobacteria bacterium]MBW2011071.1 FKBP-type peptidyl-prolyl cis-trans isomerase [Deltaproteobacteria bacterium]MBW2099680.1 FKBP-type peptidyl-prolyl cis-trans isomerase [Deltaproteobacteria bacterium]
MKTTTISTLFFCCLFLLVCTCAAHAKDDTAGVLKSNKDKVSYVIGTDISKSLIHIKDEINFDILIKGITDQFHEKKLLVPQKEAQTVMTEFSMKMKKKKAEQNRLAGEKNMEEGKNFLKKNKKEKDVVTTESGLQYLVLKQGKGPKPTKTDKVQVHYKGTTIDGTEFDSSYKRGKPASFPVTGVIKGWTEALLLMNVGSKYKLFIPSELAYGQRGAGPQIGPNAVLIFEVELLDILK